MPLVIGVTATPQRFQKLIEDTPSTTQKVVVKPEDVIESGLLKDRIIIHFPEIAINADLTMFREAVINWKKKCELWAAYCEQEEINPMVRPILVVQVEDGNERSVTQTDLKEIREYATVFRKAINAEIIDDELPAEAGIERLNAVIFAIDTATLIPYILFVERNIQEASVRNDLYDYLESYIMRRLVTRTTTKNYNQLFADRLIYNRILTRQAFIDYISGQDDKTNRMPTNDEVKAAFDESWLTNKYAAGVLYLLESRIRDRRRHSTQLLGINKYSLEHMMPKKWRNHWVFSGDKGAADLRDRKLLTLGNLTIITQALNASIRDSDWETKKSGQGDKGGLRKYADGIETLSAFLDADVWDEIAIRKRAEYLSMKALEIWSM